MSLQTQITEALKTAMKSKDQIALEALRAIKSELLLVQTSGSDSAISEQDEVRILQKLVKQRKESADVFTAQNRLDLAEPELAQIKVIEQFLPEQMSEEEVEKIIAQIVKEGSFSGMQDMGKVMGLANAKLAGAADGKTISAVVKKLLTA